MTRKRVADRAFWFLVGLSVVVLFSPTTPSEGQLVGIDKVVHAVLFGALAAATAARFQRGLGWVLLYGVVSEVLQAVLPIHRDGSFWDALADAAGAVVGWLVATRTATRRARGA